MHAITCVQIHIPANMWNLLLTNTETECVDQENEYNLLNELRMPYIEQKRRERQKWGEPRLLSRADSFLRKEFSKLNQSHPRIKASKLPLSALLPACNVGAHFMLPWQEVRRRYAEYRADVAASAYDKGSIKLFHAFRSVNPYNNLCLLIEGKWSMLSLTCTHAIQLMPCWCWSLADALLISNKYVYWLQASGVLPLLVGPAMRGGTCELHVMDPWLTCVMTSACLVANWNGAISLEIPKQVHCAFV